jgi:hypothetical protein
MVVPLYDVLDDSTEVTSKDLRVQFKPRRLQIAYAPSNSKEQPRPVLDLGLLERISLMGHRGRSKKHMTVTAPISL